ncbi:hypothetical protein BN2476_1240062 [Paraburkholderia piptadeniae]|uniref:Uncharacterized protein n=1 Tax=Paraburkholderia piptadeniae TaxID=1701573 RepID=A0A1N7SVY2_9BURK|nr:hypothetical protein BN2476_1240062 [Paraburkholderia piptadeniae]
MGCGSRSKGLEVAQCDRLEAALREAVVNWRLYPTVLGLHAMRGVKKLKKTQSPIDRGSHISKASLIPKWRKRLIVQRREVERAICASQIADPRTLLAPNSAKTVAPNFPSAVRTVGTNRVPPTNSVTNAAPPWPARSKCRPTAPSVRFPPP